MSIKGKDIDIRKGRGRWIALAAIVLSGLVIGLDTTILITALPTLSAKLGASTSELQWISAAYTLALAGLLLPAGVLGDHFGRRRLLMIGLLLFGISSVVASQMTSATGLIWMRAVMGVGGAIIMVLSLSNLPTLFSEEERPRAVALTAVGAFLGLPLGPLVAGWLLDHYAWGSVFLINAPVIVLALTGVWFLIPESKDANAPRLDWVGAVFAVVGVTGLVYGIIQQPVYGWTDARVLAGVAGGAVVLGAFVAWDLRGRAPLVDLRLFRDPRFTWATVAFAVVGSALTGVMFILTPYLQIVQGNDAQATGLRLLPMIAGVLVGAIPSDRLIGRFGARVMITAGLLISGAGLVVFAQAGADTGYGLVAGALALIGLGIGTAMPPALDTVLAAVPSTQTGGGTALTRTIQNIGASFGVAILGSILNAAYRADLASHLAGLPAPLRETVQASVAGAHAIGSHLPAQLAAPLIHTADAAYAHGMSMVLLISAGIMIGGGILIALFMPSRQGLASTKEQAA